MKTYVSAVLVSALFGAFGCNQAGNDGSTVKTIDDLADPSAAPKSCSGSNAHPGLEAAIQSGQISTAGLSANDAKVALDKLRQGLSAVPDSLVSEHLKHGTSIVLSASPGSACDSARATGTQLLADMSLPAKGLGGCALVSRQKGQDQLDVVNYAAVIDAKDPYRVVEFFGMLAAEGAYLDGSGETITTQKDEHLAALQQAMRAEIVAYVRAEGKATDGIDQVTDDRLLAEAAGTAFCQPGEMAKLPSTKAALTAAIAHVGAQSQLSLFGDNVYWGQAQNGWTYNGQQISTVSGGTWDNGRGVGQDYYGSNGQYLGSWDRTYGADGRITYDGPAWYPY